MFSKNLRKRLTAPIESFAGLGDTIQTEHGPLTWIDNGASVLAVAHLDFVLWQDKPKITKQWGNVKIENTPQLDDRLGVWVCLDVLNEAGINCDVLLTDSEESGESTAQHFNATKDYDYLIEFDRAGSDVVMYDYEDDDCVNVLQSVGYRVGNGSFTDICYLEQLGVKGFNFGVGYHGQHSENCYANLTELYDSFRKFQEFHREWEGYRFDHVQAPKRDPWNVSWYSWDKRNTAKDDYLDEYSDDLYGKDFDDLSPSEQETISQDVDRDYPGAFLT